MICTPIGSPIYPCDRAVVTGSPLGVAIVVQKEFLVVNGRAVYIELSLLFKWPHSLRKAVRGATGHNTTVPACQTLRPLRGERQGCRSSTTQSR